MLWKIPVVYWYNIQRLRATVQILMWGHIVKKIEKVHLMFYSYFISTAIYFVLTVVRTNCTLESTSLLHNMLPQDSRSSIYWHSSIKYLLIIWSQRVSFWTVHSVICFQLPVYTSLPLFYSLNLYFFTICILVSGLTRLCGCGQATDLQLEPRWPLLPAAKKKRHIMEHWICPTFLTLSRL